MSTHRATITFDTIQPPQPIDPMGAATPAGPEKMSSVRDRTGINYVDTSGLARTGNTASAIMAIRAGGR